MHSLSWETTLNVYSCQDHEPMHSTPLCPRRRTGNSLESFKIKQKAGVGCRHGSCSPTSSSLWGCALCKRPQGVGTNPPSCLHDDRRDYWHLVCEAGGRGSQACIKSSPSLNTSCGFVRKHWKSPIPTPVNFPL